MSKLNYLLYLSILFSLAIYAGELDTYPGGKYSLPRSKSELAAAIPQPRPKPSCVVQVKNTITVSENKTLDGKGCLYSWRGAGYPSKCRAPKEISEGEPPMFILKAGATLKNLQMECALDGIHTTRNNKIQKIINRDVEEDAITLGENILVEDSEFWFCQDKCMQMNRAKNIVLRRNKFFHSNFPIKAATGYNVVVEENVFYNSNRAIRSALSGSLVKADSNEAKRVGCFLAAEDKARINDYGGHSLSAVERMYCEDRGGKIYKY